MFDQILFLEQIFRRILVDTGLPDNRSREILRDFILIYFIL